MRVWLLTALLVILAIHARGQTNAYFPVTVGSVWHFDGVVEEQGPGAGTPVKVRVSMEILKSVRKKDYTHVEARMFSGNLTTGKDIYQVTPAEVRRVSTGRNSIEVMKPPLVLLKLPAAKGMRWAWSGTKADPSGRPFPARAEVVIGQEAEVKGPSGPIRAIPVEVRIRATVQGASVSVPATIWFAKDVGMARIEGGFADGAGRGVSMKLELAEYTIRR